MPGAKPVAGNVARYLAPRSRSGGRMDVPAAVYPRLNQILTDAKPLIQEAIARRKGLARFKVPYDIIEWAESRFYIPGTGKPIVLFPHQKALLRLAFTRTKDGWLPYRTLLYSTIKQSGKSTIAGIIERWYAENHRYSELYCMGNDQEQARLRSYREIRWSLEQTPGYDRGRKRLPGEWEVLERTMRCVRTSSEIRALAIDSTGEAGGKPAIQTWTELWGFETQEAIRFWNELTPIPTIPDSMRIVETYAGFNGESKLLKGLYDTGMKSHQLSAGELSSRTGCDLGVFEEAKSPDDPVPIWEDTESAQLTYWDEGERARRMPWQHGERGDAYYAQQRKALLVPDYLRFHNNIWVSATGAFIRREMWDKCKDEVLAIPLQPGDRTPIVLAADAATSSDCFAIVIVSRHPDKARRDNEIVVRGVKIFDPKESTNGVVDYDEAERYIRFICQGGHVIPGGRDEMGRPIVALHPRSIKMPGCHRCEVKDHDIPGLNVIQVCYDPYQLSQMMQRITKDDITWCKAFEQGKERLVADRALYDLILGQRIWHNGNEQLTQHVLNAGARVQKDEDSKLRLVKIAEDRKIDAVVSLSMAAKRCLELII